MNWKALPIVRRIFNDSRMRPTWPAFDDFVADAHASGSLVADLAGWQHHSRSQLLLRMATRGGSLHEETVGAIAARRKRIAKKVRTLTQELSTDKIASALRLNEVLFWTMAETDTTPGTPLMTFQRADGSFVNAPSPLAETARIQKLTVADLLTELASRLESGAALTSDDPIRRSVFAVQPGRGQQAHFEHHLVEHFGHLGRPLPAELFAPIIEVALELDAGSVDVATLADRFRKI